MAGYIEDRWLKKRPDKQTGKRERTTLYGKGLRYRVKGIPGVQDRSFATSEDAKQWLASAKTDSGRGEFVDPRDGSISLDDYIVEHWWPGRTDEPSTAGPLRSRIWNHVIPLIGDVPLKDIDASTLRLFKAGLLRRVESSTAEVIWGHLTSILNSAVDDKRLLRNPVKVHRSVKRPQRAEKKAKAWIRPTADAVRSQLQERYRFAVDLGLGLGLRQGEAFGLAEEDFDFEAGVVHVRRQLRWDIKGRPYFCLPKGGKTREVPLAPNLTARARAHFRRFPLSPAHCRGGTPNHRRPHWRRSSASPSRSCWFSPPRTAIASPTGPGTSEAGSLLWPPLASSRLWARSCSTTATGHVGTPSTSCLGRTCSTSSGTPTRAFSWKPVSRS